MQINTDVWGAPIAYYANLNVRTGASDLDDTDFTDYPAFTYNKLAGDALLDHEYDRVTLRSGVEYNSTDWIPNRDYPDISIAYCGIKNPNLPQTNVICVGMGTESPASDYTHPLICFKSNPDDVKPVMFLSNVRYSELTSNNTYAKAYNSQLNSPYYFVSGEPYYGEFFWSPNSTDSSSIANRNASLDMAYWRSFGIRSLIGIIMVRYYNPTTEFNNTSKMPSTTHIVSLQWYESQTDVWKASQKIIGAWLTLKFRRTTTGSYETLPTSVKDSFSWDCYYGVTCDGTNIAAVSGKEKIFCPVGAVTTQSTNYDLPLFGTQHGTANYYTSYSANSGGGASTQFGTLVGNDFGVLKHGDGNTTNQRRIWLERDGDADTELFRKAAAAYGLFFTDGTPEETGYADLFAAGHDADRWTDTNMCLGVIDDKGYTDGTYTKGTDNSTANNFGWKDSTQSPYNPSLPPIPDNQYSDTTVFNSIGDLATMFKRYVISASEVETLGKDLFKITDDLAVGSPSYDDYATKVNSEFLVSNPLDCIISLRRFPMEIPKDGTYTNIKLGTHTVNTCGYGMEKTAYTYLFEMSTPISPNFGDSFLDYEPYTDYELYVPFCGTIKLNPRDIIGRKLAVQLVVDFTTGTATGFVMSGNLVIETVNGNIAIDIPVSGINAATIASQLNNAIAQRETSYYSKMSQGFETVKSFVNPLKMGNTVSNLANSINAETSHQLSDYNLQHQEATPHTIGAATPVGLWAIDLNCRLICYFPTGDVITVQNSAPRLNSKIYEFGANTGFATIETNTIGAYTGLVVATNPLLGSITTQLGKSLTDEEIQGIISDLAEGVIV